MESPLKRAVLHDFNTPFWFCNMQIKQIDSSDENVSKFVFDFDSAVAEAVLYKYPTYAERTVICCSTQSGCPIGCRFCGAGDAFVRNLTASEIVEQVHYALAVAYDKENVAAREIKRLQIMFMSMGEPVLNTAELHKACAQLHELYPNAALLISTSAPSSQIGFERIFKMSKEIDKIGLQFSVHESTDEKRNKLIPFRQKFTLAEIADLGEAWHKETGRKPFFNYCAGPSNSTVEDADRLAALFKPTVWNATVSVICERTESIAAANDRQRELATSFMSKLVERGFDTRCFNPAGQDDIGGGCGQLWFVQDWMRKHPELARPSVGRHLPVVHTPVANALVGPDGC